MADGLGAYRVARRLHRLRLHRAARAVTLLGCLTTKAEVDPTAEVAADVTVEHAFGLVVGAGVRVGSGCVLHQDVTLLPTRDGAPRLGRGVVVLPGAVVLGPVSVGDGARVGANAVVLTDVEPGATADGVPGSTAAHWAQPIR